MADPAEAATAAANDADVDDLYADLDDQVTAALAAAGESGGSNAKDSDAEADANEAVDLGDGLAGYSSSDEESEDDLHIVLNEDGCAPPPPSAGRCEEESEEGEVRGSLVKGLSANDGGPRKLGGHHYKALLEKATGPITGQGDTGHQHAFQKDYYFFLPRNRTVFDINIEAFEQKPWRQHGVNLDDYFNFGLDEEGWRKYCLGMKQFTQEDRSLAEKSSGMDQESRHNLGSCKAMPKSATYSGFEGSNDPAKPKGRAIHVEGGVFGRLPSADLWRPRQRDSDVVIQVNMTLSPSNHPSSDDNSAVNDKCMTTERILVDSPGVKCLKDTSLVVDRVVDKRVLSGSSSDSECTGSKLDIRDSACTRGHSSSPDYSDMLSEKSTEDCYFKRSNRHSNSKALCSDTNFNDARVRSVLCCHSSKSDQQSSKGDSRSYTPSPSDDRYHKTTKFLRADESDFMNRQNDHRLLKPGHKENKEQKRKGSSRVRHDMHDLFDKEEKIADSYPSRYARKYEEKRFGSTSVSNAYHNAVHRKVYEKRDYSPFERAALRNGVQRFSSMSNHQRSRSSWYEFNDDEDVVQNFSSTKGWQQRHDNGYGYSSMLQAEVSDDNDGQVYRESYYQETRRVRRGHSEDAEVFHYNDYRSGELRGPEARGEYRNRRSAESNDEHFRHPYHLDLSPQANDYPRNSERDWPSPGLTSLSSRNRCIYNERTRGTMMQCDRDGYYENNKHHDSSFRADNIQRSALYTAAATEVAYCILPVKRKLHADLGSMNHNELVGLAFPKGRRLAHHQSMISDRKVYAADLQNVPKEIVREAINSFSDVRNNKTISNNHDERRHELVNFQLKNADNIHLNNRKRKFKLQGNEIVREVESDNEGCLPADKDLRSSKHKGVRQKAKKLNGIHQHAAYQDLEKKTCQKRQNTNEYEIEEGELIEEDHEYTVPESKLKKPRRKAVLRSVIEASSAGQLETITAVSEDVIATRECDDKRILAVMEKMQKRRERFKEPVVTQTEEDNGKTEQLAVACIAEDVKNQRPARKRRWGGNA